MGETLAAALRSLPEPIFVYDIAGELEFATAQAQQLLGADETIPLGLEDRVNDALRRGREYLPADYHSAVHVEQDGRDCFFLPRVCVVAAHHDGQIEGAVLSLQDVTEFHLLDQVKTDLIGAVSHELKTPLTGLRMPLLLLLEQQVGELNDTQLQLATSASQSVERMLESVTGLLDLTRFELDLRRINPAPVCASELIDKTVVMMLSAADEKRLLFQIEVAPDLPQLHVDVARIQNALNNLVSNAVRHSPEGEIIRILAALDEQGRSRISVIDCGPGVAEEFREQIFERYFKAPDGQAGGTGLGLNLARLFVEAHGGRIELESRPGQTEFAIVLPKMALFSS